MSNDAEGEVEEFRLGNYSKYLADVLWITAT